MASRVCPYCQGLNGATEKVCYRCGKRLPGPVTTEGIGMMRSFLGSEAPMTRVIIAMELIVFALCVLSDGRMPLGLGGGFSALTSVRFGALLGPLLEAEPWRFLSACFVHGGILHVGMNMFMFASFGAQLERALGWSRAVLIFLLSGILGYVATVLWRGDHAFSVGASGGVFGQVGAMIGMLAARRDPLWKKALGQMLIYAVLLSLAFGGIDNAAHFGGLFAGLALGFGFHLELTRLRLHRAVSVLALLMLLASVASVVLSTQSPALRDPHVRRMLGE